MDQFLVHEVAVQGPATHVLIMGVGTYPHLNGGTGVLTTKHGGMGQLTSCPESARAFATWVIAEFNPPVPLASVALLLSEPTPAHFTHPTTHDILDVAPATIDNIETALNAWRDRGESGAGMRLVLFFSGHGIAAGRDLTLLAQDYGTKRHNPLDGAFDFRNVFDSMELSPAREQLCFVDACRVGSRSRLSAGQNNGRPIFQQDMLAPSPPVIRRAPTFYSALPGERAFGLPGEPSVFTHALLEGLRVAVPRPQEAGRLPAHRHGRSLGRRRRPGRHRHHRRAAPARHRPRAAALPLLDGPGVPHLASSRSPGGGKTP